MSRSYLPLLTAGVVSLGLLASSASAQSDPHQPYNDGSAGASMEVPPGEIAPGRDPGTSWLNGKVADYAQQRAQGDDRQRRDDRMAYEHAMRANGRQVAYDQRRYAMDQEAYGRAMDAWREQDYACRHGSRRACEDPTPMPSEFYGR